MTKTNKLTNQKVNLVHALLAVFCGAEIEIKIYPLMVVGDYNRILTILFIAFF